MERHTKVPVRKVTINGNSKWSGKDMRRMARTNGVGRPPEKPEHHPSKKKKEAEKLVKHIHEELHRHIEEDSSFHRDLGQRGMTKGE